MVIDFFFDVMAPKGAVWEVVLCSNLQDVFAAPLPSPKTSLMASTRTDGLVALLYCDLNSFNKLLFGLRLHFWFQVKLEFMPQIFHRINIRAFKGNSPPVDILLKEGVSNSRNMLGIIALASARSKDFAAFHEWKDLEYLPKCCNRGLLLLLPPVSLEDAVFRSFACWCKPKHKA